MDEPPGVKRAFKNILNKFITKKELFLENVRRLSEKDHPEKKCHQMEATTDLEYVVIELVEKNGQKTEVPKDYVPYITRTVPSLPPVGKEHLGEILGFHGHAATLPYTPLYDDYGIAKPSLLYGHYEFGTEKNMCRHYVEENSFYNGIQGNSHSGVYQVLTGVLPGSIASHTVFGELGRLEKLFHGVDIACKFVFMQLALSWGSTLSLVCDGKGIVGHAVSFPSKRDEKNGISANGGNFPSDFMKFEPGLYTSYHEIIIVVLM